MTIDVGPLGSTPGIDVAGRSRRRSSPSVALVALVIFVVLTGLLQPRLVVPGLGAAGRPAALFGLLLLVLWLFIRLLPVDRPEPATRLRRVMFVYLLVFLAAMAAGIDRGLPGIEQRAMDRAFLITLGLAAVILLAEDGLRSTDEVETVLSVAVAVGAIGAVVGVIQFIGLDLSAYIRLPGLTQNLPPAEIRTRGAVQYRRVRGLTLHPIEYGVHLAMLIPLALHLAMTRPDWRRLRWLAVALLTVGIPLSISRSGVLALVVAVGVFVVGLTWRQRANAAVIAVVAALGFMVVTPGLLGTIRSLFLNASSDISVAGRTSDFGAVGGAISERPFLGRGPGTYIPERYRTLDNQYLATLLESGWLGLVALVLVVLTAAGTAARVVRRAHTHRLRSLARALGAGVAVALVVFATFDALGHPVFAGTLVVMIGCLAALDRLGPAADVERPLADEAPEPAIGVAR